MLPFPKVQGGIFLCKILHGVIEVNDHDRPQEETQANPLCPDFAGLAGCPALADTHRVSCYKSRQHLPGQSGGNIRRHRRDKQIRDLAIQSGHAISHP